MTEVVPVAVPFRMQTGDDYLPIFAQELETSSHILFHGTNFAHFESIWTDGWKPTRSLQSVSFARTSALALKYACDSRTKEQPEGVILAFEFTENDLPRLRSEGSVVFRDPGGPDGRLVAYCRIPQHYRFV